MLNNVQLMGRLTADPELFTGEKYTICRFSLAVQRDYPEKGEYNVDFIDIVAWNKLAEFIANHFNKGQLTVIDGKLHTRTYQDKEGKNRRAWEVIAEHIYFTGSKAPSANTEELTEEASPVSSSLASSEGYADLMEELNNISDEDYPF